MKMPPIEPTLWQRLSAAGLSGHRLWAAGANAVLSELEHGSSLGCPVEQLSSRSVFIATAEQLATALALIELDGVARRVVLCPADLPSEHLAELIERSQADTILTDRGAEAFAGHRGRRVIACGTAIVPAPVSRSANETTEWLLLTSGTTGVPKLVRHSLAGLTGAIKPGAAGAEPLVWATFYDIRRYGGLQIFLRAMLGHASLVLSSAGEATAEHLARLGRHGVTHISGTPTHWRRALMSGAARQMSPRYVRLSGEIADQTILDALRLTYPSAQIGHAYASTEAGVGFDVNDGQEGFPASLIEARQGEVEMKIVDGALHIRSDRTATGYIGAGSRSLLDADGFVDTGDMIERRGNRCYFVGRKGGIINVGGQKVNPEEVEAVINRHPSVDMSLVSAKHSPITGSIVVADVLLKSQRAPADDFRTRTEGEIRALCRAHLAPHKVPALIRFVAALEMTAGGKLARPHA